MSNIQELIRSIPLDRIALADQTHTISYQNLIQLYYDNIDVINKLKGASVVINGRKRMEFAKLLTLLDGVAEKILFLPPDIDTSLHKKYYKEANISYEIYLENDFLRYNKISIVTNQSSELGSTQWIIPTSGTTNTPKLILHNYESLTRTVKRDLDIGKSFRWGLVFDIYRFSGIQVFLQSILSGSKLIITESSQNMTDILDILIKYNCNALSATPSFWRKVLMSKKADKLQLRRITLGGEIADENILQALKIKFPDAKISHIYASTEVGVGFSVTDGHEGFPLSFLNGGLKNIKMKIDKEGLLWIAPVNKNQSYVSNENMYDKDGYINTGDIVKVRGKRVYFLGRNSGAINIGGNKVQPEEVERTLLSSDLIAEAFVYAMKNPMMGSLVCADVVLNNKEVDRNEVKKQLFKHCRERLESFKVPAMIKFVEEVQTTDSGKLKRGLK